MSRYLRTAVRTMSGYTPGEQPPDEQVIKLNTNENPYPPSPRVAAVLREFDARGLRRYPDPQCAGLRRLIAARHGCRPEQVFVGNGSDEILALAMRAFVERGGTVGYFEPSYSLYPVLAAIEELGTRPVPLAEDFRWRSPVDCGADCFMLTYPNAPTGIAYPPELVRDFCRDFPGVVLLDEAYVDFAEQDVTGLALEFDNVLSARSFSKSFALAGLRLGYAVGPAELISGLLRIKDSYNVGLLAQRLGEAALQDLDYMLRQAHRVCRTREKTALELRRRGFDVVPSQANFLWARPNREQAAGLFTRLREKGIYVRYFDRAGINDYIRISMGTEEDMDAFLEAIDEFTAD